MKKNIRDRLIAFLVLVFIGITSAIFFFFALVIWLITLPFDKNKKILHLYTCFWACFYLWILPIWRARVIDKHKIDKKKTYVIVANHQSHLDIMMAFLLFCHFKWISKAEVFRLPFIGWNMSLNQYIKLIRGDKKSIQDMFKKCQKLIANGNSIFIFPEGTRSYDGSLQKFKLGAFVLAKKMRVPILPVVINGTHKALPKYSLKFHGVHEFTIKVLDEIPYEKFKNMEAEEIAEMVRNIMLPHVQ
jgi:1-acyl-sn-glycerol-3-phosphate acyltransferase